MEIKRTESELLFEQICKKRNIAYKAIEPSVERTPDYLINIKGMEIVVEVKQLDPNSDDVEIHNQIISKKKHIFYFPDDKIRVREKIKIASKQLKRFTEGKKPGLIVLFDNTHGLSGLDRYGILTAMYGDESIPILVDEKHELEPIAGPPRFGGGRRMTENEKNYISALGIININNNEPYLYLFHNIFADIAIMM